MTKKRNIQYISDTKRCYGCFLCGDICPTSAIKFSENCEGFLYPQVNDELCIDCGLCLKKCPVNNNVESQDYDEPLVYAAWHKDSNVVKNSSSGGLFTAIAEYILEKNGIVYGAHFDETMNLNHSRASNMEELTKMRGSKYLQSNLEGIYKNIAADLKNNLLILFVGTPCQCAAVKSSFGNHRNLLIVDIICHGVNSPGVFKHYIKYLENKYNDKLQNYNFRCKDYGWEIPIVKAEFDKTIYKKNLSLDSFYAGYRKGIYLRECCYSCKYASVKRIGDITLGDFWGVPKEFYNKDGVSLLLINSDKGKEVFEALKNRIVYFKATLKDAKRKNPQLSKPSVISDKNKILRDDFFKKLENGKMVELFDKFLFGKPFPRLRKLKYYFIFFIKKIKYSIAKNEE